MTATTVEVDPWVRVLRVTSALVIVASIVVQVFITGTVIPPLIIFELLFTAALVVQVRRPSVGVWMTGVLSLLFIVGDVPNGGPQLAHPESFPSFVTELTQLGAAVVGLIVAGLAVRRARPAAARRVVTGAVAVYAVLAVVSAAAWATTANPSAKPGDIALVAKSIKYRPATATATAGSVSVHVANRDPMRHTFTIDALHVDVEVPAGKGRRVTFQAQPGVYTFHCSVPGHTDMKGTLTVR